MVLQRFWAEVCDLKNSGFIFDRSRGSRRWLIYSVNSTSLWFRSTKANVLILYIIYDQDYILDCILYF